MRSESNSWIGETFLTYRHHLQANCFFCVKNAKFNAFVDCINRWIRREYAQSNSYGKILCKNQRKTNRNRREKKQPSKINKMKTFNLVRHFNRKRPRGLQWIIRSHCPLFYMHRFIYICTYVYIRTESSLSSYAPQHTYTQCVLLICMHIPSRSIYLTERDISPCMQNEP